MSTAAALIAAGLTALAVVPTAVAAGPCDAPIVSPVACENSKPGTANWDATGGGDPSIEGFGTSMSVNVGQSISFKVKTSAPYKIDIFRLGYYGGLGARKMTATPITPTPRTQPACLSQSATGLIDCGNWQVSASWAVPSTAVSGVYIANLQRTDTDVNNHIVFIVRNDASTSKMVFQTSDPTWQAYNVWGGNSFYGGQPDSRAYKLSYNRPFSTRTDVPDGRDFVFGSEYPMIRFLERNGYDVSYISGIDADRSGSLLLNHKMFISTGHDEYWSGAQRANVEAARDAGVHLAFFSGNEVFWKTRWENSIDGSNTSYRTLVTYKETHANAKIDPNVAWTGTWRDPRFSPPSDGGKPENALTGQIWTVNCCSYAIKVPADDGKMRFWRNTSVATQLAGATATLAPNTLGYEWDEDLDNGFRPNGMIRLSKTTETVAAKLMDHGSSVAPGEATHRMTLYRAASGALVFGAGTVQWSWGLDDNHDGAVVNTDQRMQQATVNLFADMGVQPTTLMAGLVAATASSDVTAPNTTITSPAPGATVNSGDTITVTGTAVDGSRVGGVEVSLDGGASWHPANGRETWSYTGSIPRRGSIDIKARATDDSVNTDSTPASVTVNSTCPCTLFPDLAVPKTPATNDTSSINVGTRFTVDTAGYLTGVRFYKGAGNTGVHVGGLWTASGQQLATATFTNETASGWQTAGFNPAVAVQPNTQYIVSYNAPNGHYAADAYFFGNSGYSAPPLHAPATQETALNGVFGYGSFGFPSESYKGGNYWVDAVFDTVAPPDTIAPSGTPVTPQPNSSSVSASTTVVVGFDEPVQPATISFVVRNPSNVTVPGSVAYDAATRRATFTPTSPLANSTAYSVTVSGAKDTAGNTMTTPVQWSFTTQATPKPPGVCPCTVWDETATPTIVTVNDASGVELGMRLRSDVSGKITGVRFYKGPQNVGTHKGTLWSNTGTQLATVTFSNESSSGWQQANFSTPVQISANTTYVVSYHTGGFYSATLGGLNAAVDNPPLHAIANGTDGPSGVYRYGSGGAFPINGGGANYWVDAVFVPDPDLTAPTVSSVTPGNGAKSVPVNAALTATFNEAVNAGTVQFTLNPGNRTGTVTYDPGSRTAKFQPTTALSPATVYTATAKATDTSGNAMLTAFSWSFTTSGIGACPCTLFSDSAVPGTASTNDSNAVELGMRVIPDTNGWISGVRFYKGAGNTGTHTGSLWSNTGAKLAGGTFTAETASGWQTLKFANPVAVTAGTTYVVSYFAPVGRYSSNLDYFVSGVDNAPLHAPANSAQTNGLYRYGTSGFPIDSYRSSNYWVDAIFTNVAPPDTTAPTVTATNPADGVSSVPPTGAISATFDEDIQANTPVFSVAPTAGGTAVPGTLSYNAATRTASFQPSAPLQSATSYRATVSGAKDTTGNTMSASVTWTFTTAQPAGSGCPCTLFPDTATPSIPSANDNGPLELGVRFTVDTAGTVSGIRFYKGSGNTGTHVGHLWTDTGTLLGTVTFSGETAGGWQQANFASPIAVSPGTTYIASYYAPNGHYSVTYGTFEFNGVDRAPLHAPRAQAGAPNGVYRYGSTGFPTSGNDTNYWVDTVFSPSVGGAGGAQTLNAGLQSTDSEAAAQPVAFGAPAPAAKSTKAKGSRQSGADLTEEAVFRRYTTFAAETHTLMTRKFFEPWKSLGSPAT
ncbi:Mo-co oxidoreductase dimerisation domain-containing protein [Actinokineospora alba]|uniref:Mo-co oxidoreductase dimerisation domain-containing protein n=2 Tax=Actinokineospora alba TaxID=504798 RepID=A0A1H0PHM5_9PSEU|nr:molybdenum-dependent oxidoreductase-like protein [Actinokineospora alba]SDI65017.1 Mo-co oxidoreductase dimerisation domain-containing protein [Actinokineospora alba]SDP04270.1 Mo-co oxidoreductase dimerisation domain-containing protein [Actinokineospora alba]